MIHGSHPYKLESAAAAGAASPYSSRELAMAQQCQKIGELNSPVFNELGGARGLADEMASVINDLERALDRVLMSVSQEPGNASSPGCPQYGVQLADAMADVNAQNRRNIEALRGIIRRLGV